MLACVHACIMHALIHRFMQTHTCEPMCTHVCVCMHIRAYLLPFRVSSMHPLLLSAHARPDGRVRRHHRLCVTLFAHDVRKSRAYGHSLCSSVTSPLCVPSRSDPPFPSLPTHEQARILLHIHRCWQRHSWRWVTQTRPLSTSQGLSILAQRTAVIPLGCVTPTNARQERI